MKTFLEQISNELTNSADVRRVHRLEERGPRVRYLVETPFTFPRFVVGEIGPADVAAYVRCRCGLLQTALGYFNRKGPVA